MGYTHIWYNPKPIGLETWQIVRSVADALTIHAKNNGITLLYESYYPESDPEISDIMIKFNGAGHHGQSPFILTPHPTFFSCCRTDRKPYDQVVGHILWALATPFKEVAKKLFLRIPESLSTVEFPLVSGFSPSNDDGINYITQKPYQSKDESISETIAVL